MPKPLSTMSPTELRKLGPTFGRPDTGFGWQTYLARELGVEVTTVQRWVRKKSPIPIPGPAARAIRCMAASLTKPVDS